MNKIYQKTKKQFSSLTFFCTLLFLCVSANGQTTKISVLNGDWFNPATWSPAGVPTPVSPTDTLIINTQVTFNQMLDARGVATKCLRVNSGASLSGIVANDTLALGVTNYLINYGSISVNSTIAIGDINVATHNYGQITAELIGESDDFYNEPGAVIYITGGTLAQSGNFHNQQGAFINITGRLLTSDYFFNYGQIKADTLSQNGNFYNYLNGIIVANNFFVSNDSLINNGQVSTVDWTNNALVTGATGKFCISGCFLNVEDISGTVDICDASPGGFCDFNMAIIGASVTNCASGPCITNVSVNEISTDTKTNLFPNPVADLLNISSDKSIDEIRIYNSLAKIVYDEKTNFDTIYEKQISCKEFSRGIYFAEIRSGQKIIRKKFIIE